MATVTKQTVTVKTKYEVAPRPASAASANGEHQHDRPPSATAMIRNIPFADEDNNHGGRRSTNQNIVASTNPGVSEQSRARRILHMLIIVACIFLVIPLYWVMAWVAPAKSGLDCNRQSFYSHPHKDPFMSTLLFTILCYLIGLLVPMVTEIIMQYYYHDSPAKMHYSLCPSRDVPAWLYFTLKNFVVYIFGVQATQGIVYLIRKMVAIPRPDFYDVCQPLFLTKEGNCPKNTYTYEYVCRNPDESKWQNASRSFPSGHVAYAFFTAAFCTIYLERRCLWARRQHDSVRYLLRAVEFWLFVLCFASSAERVLYNSHHASDVYAGAVFGILGAVFVALLLTFRTEVYWNAPGWLRPKEQQQAGFEKIRPGLEAGDTAPAKFNDV